MLRYVRVWYGGAVIGPDNEINGITFGGVGAGTVVEHIEVAHPLDDGIEFFGGSVNARWISVLFPGDDAIDFDLGYIGSLQFVFVALGSNGDHAIEVDAGFQGDLDVSPRTHPHIHFPA